MWKWLVRMMGVKEASETGVVVMHSEMLDTLGKVRLTRMAPGLAFTGFLWVFGAVILGGFTIVSVVMALFGGPKGALAFSLFADFIYLAAGAWTLWRFASAGSLNFSSKPQNQNFKSRRR